MSNINRLSISDNGIKLLQQREGVRLKPYKDVAGLWTVGYGHLLLPGESIEDITQEYAETLFKDDLQRFEDNINKVVTIPLQQYEYDALVSFSYNIGTGGFNKSTALKRLNAGDKMGVPDAMAMWVKPKAITGRRYSEIKQFKGLQ